MKIAVRLFAMTIAVTGLVSSSFAPVPARTGSAEFTAVAMGPGPFSMPVPICGPGVPGCTK